jgi:site-specific DNA-cytosine methylase
MLTMGSLFDGIGGFPLAAVRNGVVPVWASEIEAFPIEVTKAAVPGYGSRRGYYEADGASFRPWISSAAAAHVRICPWPEREPGWPAPVPAFLWNKPVS